MEDSLQRPIWHWHRGVIDRRDRNHPNVRQVVTALIGAPSGRLVASGVYTAFSLRHPAPKIATTCTLTISPVTSPPWSSWTRSVQVAAVSCSGPLPHLAAPLLADGPWQRNGWEQAEPFRAAKEQTLRETIPLEFTGSAGDVIFWHPRALHSAGINRSAELGAPMVRPIIPCDFQRDGLTSVDEPDFGPAKRSMVDRHAQCRGRPPGHPQQYVGRLGDLALVSAAHSCRSHPKLSRPNGPAARNQSSRGTAASR